MRGTNDETENGALKMGSLHMSLVLDSAGLLAAWEN